MYLIVLLMNYKHTYDQIDQIENKLELFIENWSYSYYLKRDFDTYQRMRANIPSWAGTRQIEFRTRLNQFVMFEEHPIPF